MDTEEIIESAIGERLESWRPHPRQEAFLATPDDIFEVCYGGALGGGKTDALLVAPIVRRCKKSKRQLYEHPGFVGIIFRRTYPQLEKKIIPRARAIYESLGAHYNITNKVFTFPSGAKIFLGHMEREVDVSKYDTDEYQYVGIDQAEQFTEHQLRYISSRVRTSNPDLPALYRMAANPGGESHIYLRDRFVKPCPAGNVILLEKRINPVTNEPMILKRMYIPAKLTDNPSLMKADPEYINRLMLLPEKEREAKMNGDWFTFAGAVFSELRIGHNTGEPDNADHTIQPFNIPNYWPKILAIDWGFAANTFAIWGAISPDGILYIYRTYKAKRTNISEWASDIAALSAADGRITRIALDPSAWKDQGLELTVVSRFQQFAGMTPEKADNDRRTGVALIHEFLRWTPRPRKPLPKEPLSMAVATRIKRQNGERAYNEYLNSYLPEEPESKILPKVKFFWGENKECEDLISALQSCQYDENDKEDYAEFDGDDPVDCFRYLLKITRVYLEGAKIEQKFLKLEEEITQELTRTGDQNTYYNRMQRLEKNRKSVTPKPVRLH